MPPVLPQSMFAAITVPDVDQLLGQKPTSVADAVGRALNADLHYLSASQYPDTENRAFSAAESGHLELITRDYIMQHPLGFLSQTMPYFRAIMMRDAVHRDSLKMVSEFRRAAMHMAKDAVTMAAQSEQDLWGTSRFDEQDMAHQFRQSSKNLDDVLQFFESGDVRAAIAKMSEIEREMTGYAQWFHRAHHQSEDQKRLVRLGVTVAAGFAAGYTGGASLALISGGASAAEVGLGAQAGALLVNGATFVTVHRVLDQEIFDQPFFAKSSAFENAIDFGTDIVSATAMIGSLKFMGKMAETIPASSGELAWALDGGKNFAFEYAGFTGYNVFEASVASLVNPQAAGIESAVSHQALLENLGTLIGLKLGGMAVRGTIDAGRVSVDVADRWLMRHPMLRRTVLSPAMLMMGAVGDPAGMRGVGTAQADQLALERASLAEFRAEAVKRVQSLPADARILVLNLAPQLFDPAKVGDDALVKELITHQFGGTLSGAQLYRHMLGFDATDPRLMVWTPATDPNLDLTRLPDFWVTTGGPAMPSELYPGHETANTPWLKKAVETMQALQENHVPGIAVCLGHQLWEYSQGATVGKISPQREFGTVALNATEAGLQFPLLRGVWNDQGQTDVMASHSEGVITPPPNPNVRVLAANGYSSYQMALHPLRAGQTAEQATAAGEWVLSVQNHPELTAHYLAVVSKARAAAMRAEGLDPDAMLFRNTPEVRNLWLNALDFVAERARGRSSIDVQSVAGQGIDISLLDHTVRPQHDFFQHVNGGWLDKTQLPPGVPGFGNFGVLRKANAERLQATVEAAMRGSAAPGSHQQVLADFYASGMDVERLNQLGAEPLAGALKQLDSMTIGNLHNTFAWFHRHALGGAFTFTVEPDPKHSDRTIAMIDQGGLGLPTRDHYLMEDTASIETRAAYLDHLAATFKLLGLSVTTAQQRANSVLLIETALARSTLSPVERRDLEGQYNKMDARALRALAPNMSWDAYFTAIGATDVSEVVVKNPAFLKTLDGLVASTHPEHWHAYFTWHLINGASDYLGDAFATQKFEFYGRRLEGASEPKPRARRVLEQADALIGDALGKVFVDHHFNPEAKQQVDEMVHCIVAAFRERILTRPWMSAETKARALEKLDAVTYKIGHPDQWRDYASVTITPDAYFQNAMNARAYEFDRMVGKLGKPVDRSEWNATAPTVNANYVFEGNEMTFSAGILQPPFYDAKADPAVNFGAIGAMIGHELTHGFDDQGARFDARGNMVNLWTAEDAAKFGAKGDQLAQQFDQYEIQPGQFVLGKLTLGENIADLGGVAVAYHALQKFLEGKARVVVGGYTPEQRFFLGFAQMWRAKYTPEFAASNFRKDVHSPARFRVWGPLSNMSEFYEAFGVQPGDAMWRAPEDRIEIW